MGQVINHPTALARPHADCLFNGIMKLIEEADETLTYFEAMGVLEEAKRTLVLMYGIQYEQEYTSE